MSKKTVRDIAPKGKRILMRADFNVPMDENRKITDDSRILGVLPTIQYLLDAGAKLILMSHLAAQRAK